MTLSKQISSFTGRNGQAFTITQKCLGSPATYFILMNEDRTIIHSNKKLSTISKLAKDRYR